MTRVLLGLILGLLAACSSGEATPPAEVAPAPVVPAPPPDAIPTLEIVPPDPLPHTLNTELEQALRKTGAVIHHIEGTVTVIEDDLPPRTVTRQRAVGIAATVASMLVDPVRDQPRCFRRGSAVVCSQISRGPMNVRGSDHRPVFLVYCRNATWRLITILVGFNGTAARDVLQDPQQSACP